MIFAKPAIEISEKWDRRFLELANFVAQWSKDPSTKVGAVIVRPDRTVASVGYNGFARGCSDADELYADRDTKLSRVVHAEMNAILSAREPVTGYTLYVGAPAGPTCDRCACHVIQAGIARVVFHEDDQGFVESRKGMSNDFFKSLGAASKMYGEAMVCLTKIPTIQKELAA